MFGKKKKPSAFFDEISKAINKKLPSTLNTSRHLGINPWSKPLSGRHSSFKFPSTAEDRDDFKLIKAKKGIAIAEFKPVTIYKCPICGDEIEAGEKVMVFAPGGRINLLAKNENNIVIGHLKCVKRLPNIITEMFNDVIADKV